MPKELRHGDFIASIQNSPFKLRAENLKYEKCFFGFLDILGYRSFLEFHGNDAPLKIYQILKHSYDFHASTYETVKLKLLSDSILLWTCGDASIHFWNLLNVIQLLRGTLLDKGFLIRGGVATGNNFVDQDIIVSPALVCAYELERIAKFPRVLVASNAIDLGRKDLRKTIEGYDAIHIKGHNRIVTTNTVETDFDGKHILSPFVESDSLHYSRTGRPMIHLSGDAPLTPEQVKALQSSFEPELISLREKIIAARPKDIGNPDVKEKHDYFADKFNSWLDRYGERGKPFRV